MRLDKYLKVSRLVKRRTVANEICSLGRVEVNGKVAKAAAQVEVGDELSLRFGTGVQKLRILLVKEHVRKEEAVSMYELIE